MYVDLTQKASLAAFFVKDMCDLTYAKSHNTVSNERLAR